MPLSAPRRKLIYGAIVHPLTLHQWEALPRALLAIDEHGSIAWIEKDVESSALLQDAAFKHGWDVTGDGDGEVEVLELAKGKFIVPGFVDTHTHAPQYPNMGAGGQYELLDWLANVTFPTEAKFADVAFARRTYERVVRLVLDCGTTTCCYYGTLHLEATKVLADVCLAKGQRAFVGKCNMDRNAAPSYQEPSAAQSLADTESLITYIHSLPSSPSSSSQPLIHPILTPRFAIACTPDLLQGLSTIASRHPHMAIQTHISENAGEIAFTKQLFPDCPSYAGVYDSFGLLRRKTILAHACHLGADEMELVREREAGVSHCPTSNFNLRSGVARVGEMLDRGIKVGLGTDVSGGYAPSILTTIQHASIASKIVSLQPSPSPSSSTSASSTTTSFANKQLPIPTLLYLATLGGADLCGLADNIGNFLPGKEFDALLVDLPGNPGGEEEEEGLEAMVERFLFCGDSRNVSKVWVRGVEVGGTSFAG